MTQSEQQPDFHAADWDTYWRGAGEQAAYPEGGTQEAVLAEFWGGLFTQQLASGDAGPLRMLDLACGNGAVTGFAREIAPQATNWCLDYSASALAEVARRYDGSYCVAADARQIPLAAGSFDLVVSQFGIEYAGIEAIPEAARLVAQGGQLALVLHLVDGLIHRECALNLAAVTAVQDTEVVTLARAAFSAGFALNAGTGSVEAFKAAERNFTPAVRALEQLLKQYGTAAAGGLLNQLYADIAHMYGRMSAYEPAEIISWLDGMVRELAAYRGRMASMLAAAVDLQQLTAIQQQLEADGMRLIERRTLDMGTDGMPAAWVMVLRRD